MRNLEKEREEILQTMRRQLEREPSCAAALEVVPSGSRRVYEYRVTTSGTDWDADTQ